ncbi:MAG: pyruvate dehydrogenase complex dihydrolipoamide acetyltransferase [Alphaproteobacteria bacterium]
MAIDILMPALSPTMTEGILSKWLVKQGDEVRSGDVIAEIETDKATMEVEAIEDGVLAKIIVNEGTEGVAVNSVIAVLAEDGENISEVSDSPTDSNIKDDVKKDVSMLANDSEKASDNSALNNEIPATNQTPTDVSSLTQASKNINDTPPQKDRVFATPLARRLAAQEGIDLAQVNGTGPHGRIIERDILAFVKSEENVKSADRALSADTQKVPQQIGSSSEGRFVPHTAMRRTIASRLQFSKQTAPHFYLTVECSIDRLLENRAQLNEMAPEGVKISVNDMIIRASAMALQKRPDVNGWFEEDGCRYFDTADICMAVSIKGGLITPVIRSVEKLGLAELSQITKDLASRAREGKLKPEEYTGGGFTISNLGMFGIKEFSAVINPPQSAILAVGAGEQRAIVKDGEIAVSTMMNVTLSADHRIVDGALGAEWLQLFKGFVENPVTMLI